ncbi:MAG: hypothetical protein KAR08_07850 [Candidatus Heimdallarchaeota archaeon]|nr:hypothetical protein [Candidatus Heimdallarchaeota archaeon]
MSSENEYKKLLVIGTLIGLLGSLAIIVGMILDIVGGAIAVHGLAILTLVFGIFITCLITFLGALTPYGLNINDERPSLFALLLFIFAPTVIFTSFNTPLYFLLDYGNAVLGSGSITANFYIVFIGVALLLIAFLFQAWIFLWKNRMSSTGGLNLGGTSDIGFVKILRIITSFITILAATGIILGMILPASGTAVAGLLMYEDGTQLDLAALTFIVILAGIVITAVIMLLGNFGIKRFPNSELPVLALLSLAIILPGYEPQTVTDTFWSSPVRALLSFGNSIFGDLEILGWILIVGLLVLVLAFFLGILSFFLGKTATYISRPAREARSGGTGRLEARRKKGKFPKGPPSAPGGSPPAALSGPQSGTQPTVTSAPPSPPSFMPSAPTKGSTAAPSGDSPTCPFCGKGLRFIDEYSRWYCDTCSQYV